MPRLKGRREFYSALIQRKKEINLSPEEKRRDTTVLADNTNSKEERKKRTFTTPPSTDQKMGEKWEDGTATSFFRKEVPCFIGEILEREKGTR